MTGGAFQTSREIFSNDIWQNIVEFRLFFLIYGKAIFASEVKVGGVEVKRGQWLRSIRNLQSDLEYKENRSIKKYSTSTIDRAIKNLVKSERIKVETTELGTLFEVVNYAKYQEFDNYKNCIENAERTVAKQQENSSETVTKQIENNNKNVKNVKKVKEIKEVFISVQHLSMTEEEYNKLVMEYGLEKVTAKIEHAMNYTNLKKYVSLYLTLNNWLKAEVVKNAPPVPKPRTDCYRMVP